MIAGSHSGAGKTTVTRCLIAALTAAGKTVQTFKCGPDYIDAGHHALLSGRPCLNLDRYIMTPPGREEESGKILFDTFMRGIADNGEAQADVALVEAVGGFFDDWHHDGNSPAAIAKLLGIPVLMVFDGKASCQTLGVMAHSVLNYDPEIRFVGAVFTRVSGEQHYQRIVEVLDQRKGDLWFGYIPFTRHLHIDERHLGLVTAAEHAPPSPDVFSTEDTEEILRRSAIFDFERQDAEKPDAEKRCAADAVFLRHRKPKIAIAKDKAFSFYYAANLFLLEEAGAELEYFSPLEDGKLPDDVAFFYIGGGFPEMHADKLSRNISLLEDVKEKADAGLPGYAECGGLMYLSKELETPDGTLFPMANLFPFSVRFEKKLTLGYAECELVEDCFLGGKGTRFRGHVFHRSGIADPLGVRTLYRVLIPKTDRKFDEGYKYKNTIASYVHVHFSCIPDAAKRIVDAALRYREEQP